MDIYRVQLAMGDENMVAVIKAACVAEEYPEMTSGIDWPDVQVASFSGAMIK